MAEPGSRRPGGFRVRRGGLPGRGRGRADGISNSAQNRRVCNFFRNNGSCRFGADCKFSHDLNTNADENSHSSQQPLRVEETSEQRQARLNYNTWRSQIRNLPRPNDTYTMLLIWKDALDILNGDDRDYKQALLQDLDDHEKYCGRHHIQALLEMRAGPGLCETFLRIARYFLLVVTHASLLDSLSVDTYVGGIYNFISGPNGRRAIPFLQHVCEVLVAIPTTNARRIPTDQAESTLIALANVLCELLRREPRARYNEELPNLVNSLENAVRIIVEGTSVTSHIVAARVEELRAMIARAHGLISEDATVTPELSEVPPGSTYPRGVIVPCDRYDNDKADITEITIFPTQAEIMADLQEFIPSTDPDQPHFLHNKAARHIDTCFRLLRHDTFGQLKKALADLMETMTKGHALLNNPKIDIGDLRAYSYSNAYISYLSFLRRCGLQAQMSFLQPYAIRTKTPGERHRWWEDSRRLEDGVLLSFIWIENSVARHLFFTVFSEKGVEKVKESNHPKQANLATITTRLATQDLANVQTLVELSCQKTQGILLEYPRVLPATFVPVLENLQHMQRLGHLPFRQWILPESVDAPTGVKVYQDIPPPLYARSAGFFYSLKSIIETGSDSLHVQPNASINDNTLIDEMEAKTTLDRGQCQALVAALTREFAFIQGPPGTGKSYLGIKLMKILMDIKSQANLGPVVVVCYTNHALDQFLEHLLATGIRKVIRIGSQSRSELLEEHNLRKITQSEAKTRSEGKQVAIAYRKLEEYEQSIRTILDQLHGVQRRPDWRTFEHYLEQKHPEIYGQFSQTDGDGFIRVGRHPFDMWKATTTQHTTNWRERQPAPEAINRAVLMQKAATDIESLSPYERQALVSVWTEDLQVDAKQELFEMVEDANDTQKQLKNVHEELNRRVLQGADVIGLTTSGLAKNILTLQHVRCKVVICEEAGEVMEPHMISALLPTVEHCIQIGDHEQLRPTINNFKDLSLESKQGILYQLDRSQFERLSVGERGRPLMPVAQLNVQRRMRPDISRLIRETLYSKLVDHPSTLRLPNVVGMRKNVFWLEHNNPEDKQQAEIHHQKSKSNIWEVEMVHALIRHVVRQGVYSSSEIAVLTPYTGQLQQLRSALRNDFEIVLSDRDEDALVKDGFLPPDSLSEDDRPTPQRKKRAPLKKEKLSELLRIATVDNFQGEEAKIIIISLVRSNAEKKVGFLKTTNRINVLLSRAQHGMYLIGNTETYSNVPMWQQVIGMLRATNSVGTSLGLCCPRHMGTTIEIQRPDDFQKFSPEGGCREACQDRLPDCGHRCQARCHSKAMHDVWRCEQSCQRQHEPCKHPCQKPTCGEDCGVCMVVLNHVSLPCGHFKDQVSCYLTQNLHNIRCEVLVDKTVPDCKHTVRVYCSKDIGSEVFRCPNPCSSNLPCGHKCPGTCGSCNVKDAHGGSVTKHLECQKVCGRRFGTCNHTCPKRCHSGTDCGLCQAPCEVQCKHSRCNRNCHEACAPCVERCTWSCPHQGDCNMPCAAPCDRLPCDQRCTRLLPCGHQCPGLCGEDCPAEYCQACQYKLDARVDMMELKEYGEINLDETPIIVLNCGHFFTTETLDGVVGLNGVYEIDPRTGQVVGLKDTSELAKAIPRCPDCQTPIRQYATQRYNRLINRAVIDEMTKRFIVTGQTDLQKIEVALDGLVEELNKMPPIKLLPAVAINQLSLLRTSKEAENRAIKELAQRLQKRYQGSSKLQSTIRLLQRRVADQHQPAHKLHEATLHALRQAPLGRVLTGLSLHDAPTSNEKDQRITLGAKMADIKAECLIIEDKFGVLRAVKSKYPDAVASLKFPGGSPGQTSRAVLQLCADFIDKCTEKNLPKLAVQATLCYARITRAFQTAGSLEPKERNKVTQYRDQAKQYLEKALKLCEQEFQEADVLLQAVEDSIKLLGKEWYEEVTAGELAAIKQAMVGGRGGIATHSGHWYNCRNGHPFAIGECGMPMEQARCPECGAGIGGQNHEAVEGVTRAIDMEL